MGAAADTGMAAQAEAERDQRTDRRGDTGSTEDPVDLDDRRVDQGSGVGAVWDLRHRVVVLVQTDRRSRPDLRRPCRPCGQRRQAR